MSNRIRLTPASEEKAAELAQIFSPSAAGARFPYSDKRDAPRPSLLGHGDRAPSVQGFLTGFLGTIKHLTRSCEVFIVVLLFTAGGNLQGA